MLSLIHIFLKRYEEVARKYMLSLNEAKLTKEKIPFVLDVWLKETSLYVTQTSNVLFYTEDERKLYIDKKKQELQENASHENSEDTVVPHMFKACLLYTSGEGSPLFVWILVDKRLNADSGGFAVVGNLLV